MRRVVLAVLVVLGLAGSARAQIAHVGDSTVVDGSGNIASLSITVTAGDTVFVFVGQTTAAARTYTVSGSIGGSFTQVAYVNTSSQAAGIWALANHPGGSETITVTAAGGATAFRSAAAEFSGLGTSYNVDATDTLEESSGSSTNHFASSSGITSANTVLSLVAGALSGNGTELNPGTGYTEVTNGFAAGATLFEWQLFASGATNERGQYTQTSATARLGRSTIALISAGAAAPSTPKRLMLLGVGGAR